MKSILFILSVIMIASCHSITQKQDIAKSQDVNYDSIKNILEDIYIKDNTLRVGLIGLHERYKNDSKNMKFYRSLIERQDSLNRIPVINILNKYGWLGKSDVGNSANKALFLVIQHGDIEMQEKYIPLMKESVEKKESNVEDYAEMFDRILVRKGNKQEYGTQLKYTNGIEHIKLCPIRDSINVDKRRLDLGMDSLNVYLKVYGIHLDYLK